MEENDRTAPGPCGGPMPEAGSPIQAILPDFTASSQSAAVVCLSGAGSLESLAEVGGEVAILRYHVAHY